MERRGFGCCRLAASGRSPARPSRVATARTPDVGDRRVQGSIRAPRSKDLEHLVRPPLVIQRVRGQRTASRCWDPARARPADRLRPPGSGGRDWHQELGATDAACARSSFGCSSSARSIAARPARGLSPTDRPQPPIAHSGVSLRERWVQVDRALQFLESGYQLAPVRQLTTGQVMVDPRVRVMTTAGRDTTCEAAVVATAARSPPVDVDDLASSRSRSRSTAAVRCDRAVRRDAQRSPRFAHAALQHVTHAQHGADPVDARVAALERKGARPPNDGQPLNSDSALRISSAMPSQKYRCRDRC